MDGAPGVDQLFRVKPNGKCPLGVGHCSPRKDEFDRVKRRLRFDGGRCADGEAHVEPHVIQFDSERRLVCF